MARRAEMVIQVGRETMLEGLSGRGVGQESGATGREEEIQQVVGRGDGQCAGNLAVEQVQDNNQDRTAIAVGGNSTLTSTVEAVEMENRCSGWLNDASGGLGVGGKPSVVPVSEVVAPAMVSAVAVAVEEAAAEKLLLCRQGRRPMRDGAPIFSL